MIEGAIEFNFREANEFRGQTTQLQRSKCDQLIAHYVPNEDR